MVTVVDAANFLHEYNAADALQDRGESLGEDDNRTVTDLLIDQIEFADVIVLNKLDLVSEAQGLEVEAIIKALNPGAVIRKATHGQVPLDSVLNTGLFDYDKASTSAGWIRELEGEHPRDRGVWHSEFHLPHSSSFDAESSGTTSTTKTIGTASYVLRVSLGSPTIVSLTEWAQAGGISDMQPRVCGGQRSQSNAGTSLTGNVPIKNPAGTLGTETELRVSVHWSEHGRSGHTS